MTVIRRTTVEIDVMRLDKSKFREFTRQDGTVAKILTLDVLETDTPAVVLKKDNTPVKGSNGSMLMNVGFVVQSQTKEEREAKKKSVTLGKVTEWKQDEQPAAQDDNQTSPDDDGNTIDVSMIPF